MRISVDKDRCIGAGQCVLSAPDVFDQADDGLVVVLAADVPAADGEAAKQAQRHCPSGSIVVHED